MHAFSDCMHLCMMNASYVCKGVHIRRMCMCVHMNVHQNSSQMTLIIQGADGGQHNYLRRWVTGETSDNFLLAVGWQPIPDPSKQVRDSLADIILWRVSENYNALYIMSGTPTIISSFSFYTFTAAFAIIYHKHFAQLREFSHCSVL